MVHTTAKRIKSFDFLKGLAILAVALDHSKSNLLLSDHTWRLSAFSVSLFIFVAGMTSYISMKNRMKTDSYDWRYVLSRLKRVIVPYVVAVAAYSFIEHKAFILNEYINELLSFNAVPPYYYILFFVQLILIAPVCYLLIERIEKPWYHMLLLFLSGVVSVLSAKYTHIANVWGGGKYLFGGTYLFVFVMGMLFWKYKDKVFIKRNSLKLTMLISGLIIIGYFFSDCLAYAKWTNPPGVLVIIYAFSIGLFGFSCYECLPEKVIGKFRILEIMGTYSLDIFLYHILIMRICDFIMNRVGASQSVLYGAIVYILCIGIPILGRKIYSYIKSWLFCAEVKKL